MRIVPAVRPSAPGQLPGLRRAVGLYRSLRQATLFTYTVAHQQFHPAVPTPFVIALVELVEQPGLRLVTNLVDCDPDSLTTGMALRVRFEQHGETFMPVFAPA